MIYRNLKKPDLSASISKQGNSVKTGTNLRRIRSARGLSAKQLAEIVGTSGAQLTRLEKGQRRFTDTWLKRISKALDVTVSELISELGNNNEIAVEFVSGPTGKDEIPSDNRVLLKLPIDERFPNAQRYAVLIERSDPGSKFSSGSIVVCAHVEELNQVMTLGDFYHVRINHKDGWQSLICELDKDINDRLKFSPCTKHNPKIGNLFLSSGNENVSVTGFVIGKYLKV